MSEELQTLSKDTLAAVILNGDLSRLTPPQKVEYVVSLCRRVGLDPATQPFKLMRLNGKEIAYADRSCAAQLNQLHGLSHQIMGTEKADEVVIVTDRCTGKDGRFTEEIGAVPISGLKGEALTNALMKARTKAMRRATLTHVGLGLLDETETDSIPGAQTLPLPALPAQPVEWTEEERSSAKSCTDDLCEVLLNAGISAEEVEELMSDSRSKIGDPELPYSSWENRFLGFRERKLKKYNIAA